MNSGGGCVGFVAKLRKMCSLERIFFAVENATLSPGENASTSRLQFGPRCGIQTEIMASRQICHWHFACLSLPQKGIQMNMATVCRRCFAQRRVLSNCAGSRLSSGEGGVYLQFIVVFITEIQWHREWGIVPKPWSIIPAAHLFTYQKREKAAGWKRWSS